MCSSDLGGLPGGERASRTVIECLAEQIEKSGDSEIQLRTSILDGVEAANLRLLSEGKGSATTLVVAEIEGRSVRPYHVGDSQILITGQRGLVKLQTLSHSPIGFAQESGMIDESDALHHEDRHLVSNLVGTAEMRIEIGPSQRLALHDTLLLATDGLFDNLYNDELVEMIRKGPLMAAAERVIERVTARMSAPKAGEPSKADDLAFILYRRSR